LKLATSCTSKLPQPYGDVTLHPCATTRNQSARQHSLSRLHLEPVVDAKPLGKPEPQASPWWSFKNPMCARDGQFAAECLCLEPDESSLSSTHPGIPARLRVRCCCCCCCCSCALLSCRPSLLSTHARQNRARTSPTPSFQMRPPISFSVLICSARQ